jgi:endo-1,4-beta-xylanase
MANNTGWTEMSGTFSETWTGDLEALTFVFAGPDAGIDIYLDEAWAIIADRVVVNGDFEDGTTGWSSFGSGTASTQSTVALNGEALLYSGRTDVWNGPSQDILGRVSVGQTLEVNAWVRIAGSSSETVGLTLLTVAGGQTYYQTLGSVTATDTDWAQMTGTLSVDYADPTALMLYLNGAPAGVDFYLDDVLVYAY